MSVLFWVVKSCGLADRYKCCRDMYCLHLQHWGLHSVTNRKTNISRPLSCLYFQRVQGRHLTQHLLVTYLKWFIISVVIKPLTMFAFSYHCVAYPILHKHGYNWSNLCFKDLLAFQIFSMLSLTVLLPMKSTCHWWLNSVNLCDFRLFMVNSIENIQNMYESSDICF
jgi:hypothetical protein